MHVNETLCEGRRKSTGQCRTLLFVIDVPEMSNKGNPVSLLPHHVHKLTMMSQSNTRNFIGFIIVLGQHVSILVESYSGPSKKIDPYLKCLKMRCVIPNAYIPYKTMSKMHVSFRSIVQSGLYNRTKRQ
jgi:hypothetical protein